MPAVRALACLALAPLLLLQGCSDSSTAPPIVSALGSAALLPIGGGNALTLPAQRHLARIGGTLLLSLQQDGADGHRLGLFRSDDDGASFQRVGPIQDTAVDRDTADLVVVEKDVALVYSYEGPDLAGSTAHDVYFQWWRHGGGSWSPDPAVRIFDSTSSANGFYRAELAFDSLGRIWVQAFYLESDGSATARAAVSLNGGASFTAQPALAHLAFRGGGRLLATGTGMVFVYDGHDDGTQPAYYRTRRDADALGSWSAEQVAFAEGIYHGASLSAVADGHGGMHLVYKDKNQTLWYRGFDGTRFGAAQRVEDVGDWELQPAVTRIGDDLAIFYNRVLTSGSHDEVRVRTLHAGALSAATVLDSTAGFKGYPAALELAPATSTNAHCFFGDTPDADSGGQATLYTIGWTPSSPPPPADLAVPPEPDLGGATSSLLFADGFDRQIAPDQGLGANWTIGAGFWYSDGRAISDLDGGDLAGETAASCRDCRVSASVISFGVAGAGVYLRGAAAARYDLVLLANRHVQIRRVSGGVTTTLGDAVSGAASLSEPVTLSLQATGTSPVTLVGAVNGATRLTVNDGGAASLVAGGAAGLWTSSAGVPFDDFQLWSAGGGGAGPSDMAVPRDLSVAPRDLSVAPRDLSVAPRDLSAPPGSGTLFSDGFGRSIAPDDGLGGNWTIAAGDWYADGRAVSDLDGSNLAAENLVSCRDCAVQAKVITFGTTGGVYLRAPSPTSSDRYDFVLLSNGHVQLRRVRAGAVTVLGDAASGATDLGAQVTLSLSASGAGPVTLIGSVGGATKLSLTDSSGAALGDGGYAGLWTSRAGVPFDDFSLAGSASASGGGGGDGALALQVTFTDTAHVLQAVDPSGTAYATSLSDGSATHVYASSDGRAWSSRGAHAAGGIDLMTSLSSGTLLAVTREATGNTVARSTNHGVTWTDTLSLGVYRGLSPHSFAELDGTVYFIEYQTFTEGATPIRLWASTDGGASWSTRYTFNGHRHGHGLCADPATHVLWVYFGDTDPQSGIYRSSDGGSSWQLMLGNQDGDVVDATPLPGGGLLFGQDISYLPTRPSVARLDAAGNYTILAPIIGPSYAIHALAAGGFVVSSERENGGDLYPPGEVSAHLYGSADGVTWTRLLDYPWADANADYVRADVYWELPSTHELVLTLYNAAGFGPGGQGYQLLRRR